MLEIHYCIDSADAVMYVADSHRFYLATEQWIKASELNVGDRILATSGAVATITQLQAASKTQHYGNLKGSHNHHYFMSQSLQSRPKTLGVAVPSDPLELIPYQLADRPSHLPNGDSTGHHSGPWVAARYVNQSGEDVLGWGCATDNMCAEDVAINDLIHKLSDDIQLHRGNVEISFAYIRKYTRKGRFVNTMSPCTHCRDNYGSALNDKSVGNSDVEKVGRHYLPVTPTD